MNLTYIFFDIETSVDAQNAVRMIKPPIIWIVAQGVNAEDGTLIEGAKFDQKILFREDRADPEILELIKYKAEDWEDAKPPAMVADMFAKWVEKFACVERVSKKGNTFHNAVLAGHNVKAFDIPVLLQWYQGLKEHFGRSFWLPVWYAPHVDTLNMLQVYEGIVGTFQESNSLSVVCDRLGINAYEGADHHPYYDTLASIDVWRKLHPLFVKLLGDQKEPTTLAGACEHL